MSFVTFDTSMPKPGRERLAGCNEGFERTQRACGAGRGVALSGQVAAHG
jgi:hypothetical protein